MAEPFVMKLLDFPVKISRSFSQVRERLLVAYYRYSGEAGHSSHFDIVRLSFQSTVLHLIVVFAGVRFAEADRV